MKLNWLRWAIPLGLLLGVIYFMWIAPMGQEPPKIDIEFSSNGSSS